MKQGKKKRTSSRPSVEESNNSYRSRPGKTTSGVANTRINVPFGNHTRLTQGVTLTPREEAILAGLQSADRAPSTIYGRERTWRTGMTSDSRIALGDKRSPEEFDRVISQMMRDQNMASLKARGQVQYGNGGRVPQYGLGGILRGIAQVALPIAGSLLGGPVGGIVGGAISSAIGGGNSNEQAQQQVQGPATPAPATTPENEMVKGLTQDDLSTALEGHIEAMHARRTDSRASVGGGFRFGGPLPMRTGGALKRLGGTAVEFKGPSHEQGGIRLNADAEVEGGETMDFVAGTGGSVSRKGVPYIFSDAVKVPGSTMTFAKYHKSLVKRGASPDKITSLAQRQESVTGRNREGEYGLGGALSAAGSWLGQNAGNIAMLAPSLLNLGRAAFSNTEAPEMGSIEAQQIAGPNRAAYGPVARTGLNELRGTAPLRLDYSEAYNRNAAATRTAQAGMGAGAAGIAGRLAALAGARRGNLQLAADKGQRQDMFNAQSQMALQQQRGALAGQYDQIDSRNRMAYDQSRMSAEQFNAAQRSGADQFNTQANYQNQVGRQQASEARWNMFGAGLSGMSQFAQANMDRNAQRDANRAQIGIAMAGASDATRERIMNSPWFERIMGGSGNNLPPQQMPRMPEGATPPQYPEGPIWEAPRATMPDFSRSRAGYQTARQIREGMLTRNI